MHLWTVLQYLNCTVAFPAWHNKQSKSGKIIVTWRLPIRQILLDWFPGEEGDGISEIDALRQLHYRLGFVDQHEQLHAPVDRRNVMVLDSFRLEQVFHFLTFEQIDKFQSLPSDRTGIPGTTHDHLKAPVQKLTSFYETWSLWHCFTMLLYFNESCSTTLNSSFSLCSASAQRSSCSLFNYS